MDCGLSHSDDRNIVCSGQLLRENPPLSQCLILTAPNFQQNDSIVPDFNKTEKSEYTADTGDIITNLKPEAEVMAPTKYVAVKMKKSDLTVNNAAAAASSNKSNDKVSLDRHVIVISFCIAFCIALSSEVLKNYNFV